MNQAANDDQGSAAARDAEAAVPALIAQLSHKKGLERQHARQALVALGTPAVGALIAALGDKHDVVRWEAAKAFTELQTPVAADALAHTLSDDDGDVRWLAAEALAALGRAGLEPVLSELIAHPESVELRTAAHHVLHSFRDGPWAAIAAPVLETLNGLEPEMAVAFSAQKALDELERTEA